MEHNTSFFDGIKAVQQSLKENFTYIDIGCSGGIDEIWRLFGDKLRAYCFDPNVKEIQRLNNSKNHNGIFYIDAFIEGTDKTIKGIPKNNPFERFSCTQTVNILKKKKADMESVEKTGLNLWGETELTKNHISIPGFLKEKKIKNVDFIKIDVDGNDYKILHSMSEMLKKHEVLGVGIEVNFFGEGTNEENSFHNVDRFMKQRGYTLFALSTRKYSLECLPGKYAITMPAQTEYGRIFQGDAVYLKDTNEEFESVEKILKLAMLFSMFDLPDCAVDLVLRYKKNLQKVCKLDFLIDVFTRQSLMLSKFDEKCSYKSYMNKFAQNDKMFYPQNCISKIIPRHHLIYRILSKLYRKLKRFVG